MFAKRYQAHLLVVDVQERLVPAIHDVEAVVANIARLVRYATILGVPVTYTEHMPERIGHLVSPLRNAGPGDGVVLQKSAFSSWQEPTIAARLQSQRQLGATQIVICGMETHVCVLQTSLDLLAQNFEVLVVADAVGSRTDQNRNLAIGRLERAGAAIVSHEMIAFEWLERGDAPEFKDILPLLK
ncbi:MAG: hydrolase [Hyphomicrobiaceae bacterium]